MIRNGITPGGPAAKSWRANVPNAPPRPSVTAEDKLAGETAQHTLRKGITLTFIGFAITLGLSFIGYDDNKWVPGPWLLGGLVPMFVGLAQVTIALMTGASIGTERPRAQETTYYSAPPPPPGPAPNFDSSYTYRPGGTQELRPPTSPPERKS